MKNKIVVFCTLLASVAFGTTPSNLEESNPPTLDELWSKSTRVVHGTIVAQKFFRQDYSYILETTVSLQHSWKGLTLEELNQTAEISFIEVSFTHSPKKLYDFEVGADYVVFLGDAREPYDGYLHFTMPIKFPAGVTERFHENSSSDMPTGDGYKMKDKWKVRQFLKPKEFLTKESIQTS